MLHEYTRPPEGEEGLPSTRALVLAMLLGNAEFPVHNTIDELQDGLDEPQRSEVPAAVQTLISEGLVDVEPSGRVSMLLLYPSHWVQVARAFMEATWDLAEKVGQSPTITLAEVLERVDFYKD